MKKWMFLLLVGMLSIVLVACSDSSSGDGGSSDDGGSADYKIVFAHPAAEISSLHVIAEKFKEEIEAKSEGQIAVEIYPNAQLGGDREVIEAVQTGDVTLSIHSTAPAVNFVKDLAVFDTPFLFPSTDVARAAVDVNDPFFDLISKSQEENGFKLLGFHDQGFRQLTINGVDVQSPEDLKGVRLRTMENEYHMETWKALGANPTPLPFNEVYTALQQGTVDGQENPFDLIISQRFYEQQEYVYLTNHLLQTIQAIMNLDFYNSLPENLQVMVQETMLEALQVGNDYIDEQLAENKATMEEAGAEVIELSPEQLKAFQAKTENVEDIIRENVNEEVLDALIEAVDKNK